MSFDFVPIKTGKPLRGSSFNMNKSLKSSLSTTAGSALTEMHVHKVSEAKEFEGFRNIPKFSKPVLAVIHPSPTKKRPPVRKADLEFELEGSPARLLKKQHTHKEIPEHLMKPPIEATPTRQATRVSSASKKGSVK